MSVFISKQLTVPSLGKALSDYAVGESVFLNVNGALWEFLVVQQGKPSSVYDDSCDGTWLLMKDIYTNRVWDSTDNDYANSDIHAYLNGTFLGLFDADVQGIIKQVKIPYRAGSGTDKTVTSGSNGLPAKVFLLSCIEVNYNTSYAPIDGVVLSYFNDTDSSKRIAYLNGSAANWHLRSPSTAAAIWAWWVKGDSKVNNNAVTDSRGIRPCVILPFNTKFDPDTNEVKV